MRGTKAAIELEDEEAGTLLPLRLRQCRRAREARQHETTAAVGARRRRPRDSGENAHSIERVRNRDRVGKRPLELLRATARRAEEWLPVAMEADLHEQATAAAVRSEPPDYTADCEGVGARWHAARQVQLRRTRAKQEKGG